MDDKKSTHLRRFLLILVVINYVLSILAGIAIVFCGIIAFILSYTEKHAHIFDQQIHPSLVAICIIASIVVSIISYKNLRHTIFDYKNYFDTDPLSGDLFLNLIISLFHAVMLIVPLWFCYYLVKGGTNSIIYIGALASILILINYVLYKFAKSFNLF